MSEIDIPLGGGIDQSIDTKILPNGALSALTDVRFRKLGKVGQRRGYQYANITNAAVLASAEYAPGHEVHILDKSQADVQPRVAVSAMAVSGTVEYISPGNSGFQGVGANAAIANLGCPSRLMLSQFVAGGVSASDVAYAGNFIYVAYCDSDVISGTATPAPTVTVDVLDAATRKVLRTNPLEIGTNPRNPHFVVVGTKVLLFYTIGTTAIRCAIFDSTSALLFDVPTTVTTATATSATAAQYHHAAIYDSTTAILCYQSGAAVMSWGTVDVAGTFTSKATWAVTNTVRPCMCRVGNASTDVAVVWCDGATLGAGTVSYGTWTIAGAVATATTLLDNNNGGRAAGFPVIAPIGFTTGVIAAWNHDSSGVPDRNYVGVFRNGVTNLACIPDAAIVSIPFTLGTGTYAWIADAVKTRSGGSPLAFGTFRLWDLSLAGGTLPSGIGYSPCTVAPLQALPGKYALATSANNDTRRSVVAVPGMSAMPGVTCVATSLPVLGADGVYRAELVTLEAGPLAERLQSAIIQGQLFFSGGRIAVYDGANYYESGLYGGPAELYAGDGGVVGSGLDAGTYQYVAVFEWIDVLGQRHLSPPSNPVSITVAANHKVTLTATGPICSGRLGAAGSFQSIATRFYRTLAGGTVFYLANASPVGIGTYGGAYATYDDISNDATTSTREVLYTQGAQGGLSGILQNDEPPAAKFVWAGSDRLILGGLEDPSGVQFSKLVFPGEPVRWSASEAFRVYIDSPVTGVASLDGMWFVFSRSAIWAFSGQGPDDAGNGDFSSPRRIPSSVGCLSGRSIVETKDGLMFLGQAGIYLLPRGGGAPEWIGERVQDVLVTYPIITCALFDKREGLAYFGCVDATGTTGTILIYDVNYGQWQQDTFNSSMPLATLSKFGDSMVLNGWYRQSTTLFADNPAGSNVSVVPVITTGDIRPFGTLGWGRTRKVCVLGEIRSTSVTTTLLVEVSTDSGVTFTQIGSFVISVLTGAVGTRFRKECLLPYPRAESFRFRLTLTPTTAGAEVPVLNSLTLEVFKAPGTTRLAASERA